MLIPSPGGQVLETHFGSDCTSDSFSRLTFWSLCPTAGYSVRLYEGSEQLLQSHCTKKGRRKEKKWEEEANDDDDRTPLVLAMRLTAFGTRLLSQQMMQVTRVAGSHSILLLTLVPDYGNFSLFVLTTDPILGPDYDLITG